MGLIENSVETNYILERFLAIASSTALSCFSNSSRRVVFFDDEEFEFAAAGMFDEAVLADDSTSAANGDGFFFVSTFLLEEVFRSEAFLSRALLRGVGVLSRELSLLDVYDESDEALESDEPDPEELRLRLLFLSEPL